MALVPWGMLDRPLSLAALVAAPLWLLDILERSGRAEPVGLEGVELLGRAWVAVEALGRASVPAGAFARVAVFGVASGRVACAPAGERAPAVLGLALPA